MDLPTPRPLVIDPSSTGQKKQWEEFHETLELFYDASNIIDQKRKKAMLLYLGGEDLRKIHSTICPTDEKDTQVYDSAVKRLTSYFATRINLTSERHKFRVITQQPGESVKSFVTNLADAAKSCQFDNYSLNDAIVDSVIEKTNSSSLRRKLLMEDHLTLEKVLKISAVMESTEQQVKEIEASGSSEINCVNSMYKNSGVKERRNFNPKYMSPNKPKYSESSNTRSQVSRQDSSKYKPFTDKNTRGQNLHCYGCGSSSHIFNDESCPAKGRSCNFCGILNHFESQCSRKQSSERKSFSNKETYVKQMQNVKLSNDSSDEDYIFNISSTNNITDISVKVEENPVNFLRDTGASVNVIDRNTYNIINEKSNIKLHPTKTKIYPYGQKTNIELDGVIYVNLSHGVNKHLARVHVTTDPSSGCILGRESAVELGLIKLTESVQTLSKQHIADMMKTEFPELFQGLGKLKNIEIKFDVDENVTPVAQHLRRVPFHVRKKVEMKIKQMIEMDVIEPVTESSNWVSPIVAVPKGNDIRLVIDMRKPNEAIRRKYYPVPTLEELLNQFNNCVLFTKVDLNHGYHQISLSEESRELTTFITHEGIFRYKRLVQGANSALEEYQKAISTLFNHEPLIANICDDILVGGRNIKEHDENVRKCLQILSNNNLTVNEDKCLWQVPEVTFFGHKISADGIKPTTNKIDAIKCFPSPRTEKEVASFLGMITYLARFIPNLAEETAPLRKLLRKDIPWKWDQEEENTFLKLKDLVASSKVVAHFNPSLETSLVVDAGKSGIGAILLQTQPDGNVRPVSFASRSLTAQEVKYSQLEKEALSVVWGCERFHLFLYGKHFKILTDHQPLSVIYSPNGKPSPRVLRWGLRLQTYDFSIHHIPGKINPADMLSINPLPATKTDIKDADETEKYINKIICYSAPKAVSISDINSESENDETLIKVKDCITKNEWVKLKELQPYYQIKDELAVKGGIILRGDQIVIPTKLRKRVLDIAHSTHMGITKTKSLLKSKVWWPKINDDIEIMIKSCIPCISMTPTKKEPMRFIDFPMAGPWQQVHVDICGPYQTGEYVLGIIDVSTRWPDLHVINNTSSETIVRKLKNTFSTHGYPEIMITDNASNFVSSVCESFCKENAIQHKKITPYHPQSNSEIERFYRTLGKFVKTTHSEGRCWKNELDDFLLMYRNTPHSTTSVSPAKLLMNRNLRDKLPSVQDKESPLLKKIRKINAEKKLKSKSHYDDKFNVKYSEIQCGDLVLLKRMSKSNKLHSPYETTPGKVIERSGQKVVVMKEGTSITRNICDVKRIPHSSDVLSDDFENINIQTNTTETENEQSVNVSESGGERPKRQCGPPVRYDEYLSK